MFLLISRNQETGEKDYYTDTSETSKNKVLRKWFERKFPNLDDCLEASYDVRILDVNLDETSNEFDKFVTFLKETKATKAKEEAEAVKKEEALQGVKDLAEKLGYDFREMLSLVQEELDDEEELDDDDDDCCGECY